MTGPAAPTLVGNLGERGFILVAVAWILSALATLASIYAVYAGNAAVAAHITDDRLRLNAAAISALELSAQRLLSGPGGSIAPQGAFSFELAGSSTEVGFVSEGARVDLNTAPKELLAGLFAVLGASQSEANAYADHVVAWRKSPATDGQTSEADAYRSAGYAYPPRQGPFRSVLELPLVRAIPPGIAASALAYVTIFSGRGDLDFRVARAELLGALPEASPERIKILLDHRGVGAKDVEAVLQKIGPTRLFVAAANNPAVRVNARTRLDNGREGRVEAVILVTRDDPTPYRVLFWRDDIDSP